MVGHGIEGFQFRKPPGQKGRGGASDNRSGFTGTGQPHLHRKVSQRLGQLCLEGSPFQPVQGLADLPLEACPFLGQPKQEPLDAGLEPGIAEIFHPGRHGSGLHIRVPGIPQGAPYGPGFLLPPPGVVGGKTGLEKGQGVPEAPGSHPHPVEAFRVPALPDALDLVQHGPDAGGQGFRGKQAELGPGNGVRCFAFRSHSRSPLSRSSPAGLPWGFPREAGAPGSRSRRP